MRKKPLYDGYTVQLPNEAGELEAIGCLTLSRSVERLIAVKAFVYRDALGQISVRLECKGRGSSLGYWVGYKRIDGRLRKTYICEAYALDPYNLGYAARRLIVGY